MGKEFTFNAQTTKLNVRDVQDTDDNFIIHTFLCTLKNNDIHLSHKIQTNVKKACTK